jgi:hypothetical protein
MGNARTHLPGTNDTDFFDFHLGFLAQSIQEKLKAYPPEGRTASLFRACEIMPQ